MEPASKKIRSLTAALLNVYEELSLLYTLTAQLGRLTAEEDIIAAALNEAMQVVPADEGLVVTWTGQGAKISNRVGTALDAADLDCIAGNFLGFMRGRSRSSVLVHDVAQECGRSAAGAVRLLASSLSTGGVPEAYLCLARLAPGPIFTSVDQKLIAAVSAVTALAIENVRLHRSELNRLRLEHELEMARSIQRSLLPRDFRCRTFLHAAGESQPCYEIGGDYYDLVPVGGDECLCVIADVSGKGPAAALKAAMVQGNVQALCRDRVEVSRLLATLNSCFRSRADAGSFVTAFVGILDRAGRFRYSNGGHNPALLVRPGGAVAELAEGGPLLGFFDAPEYREGCIQLAPGDLVLLYTDGVTDCENELGEAFGLARLIEWAAAQAARTPDAARQDLIHRMREFAGDRPRTDDLTFLALRYTGEV